MKGQTLTQADVDAIEFMLGEMKLDYDRDTGRFVWSTRMSDTVQRLRAIVESHNTALAEKCL